LLENAGIDEVAEGLVIEIVTGEFGVLCHHVDDNLEEVGIALDLGGVAIGVMDGIDESLALSQLFRELLDLGTDGICMFPFDAAVEGVEVIDDSGEGFHFWF